MTQIRRKTRNYLKILIRVICVNLWLSHIAAAQAPEILKVDPPSWWTGSSVNPVRLMIRGRNFQGARVRVDGMVGTPKINYAGTYIFVDVSTAQAGKRTISVGSARASF